MNILLLSVGTRNKIVQYFKKELAGQGNVIVTDMQKTAPAIYDADKFYIVPRITDPNYIDIIIDICKKEHIKGVLSLIDPELNLLAKNKERFNAIGVEVIGSSIDLCDRALNKMNMYKWLVKHNYKCAKSYDNIDNFRSDFEKGEITFPVFVKPIEGSASISINKVYNFETLENVFKNTKGLMIQQYLKGQELGIDVYIDMISHKVISIFCKKKLLMRAGETDKAVSYNNKALLEYIERFVLESGWNAQIDIDVFEIDGEFYISEVNPRFGGGYPHAYESGCNHMRYIINNLKGNINDAHIGEYDNGIYMMKYNEIKIIKE